MIKLPKVAVCNQAKYLNQKYLIARTLAYISNSCLQWLLCTWSWYFLYAFHCLFVQVPMVLCIKVGTKSQAKWLQWRKYV